MERDSNKRYFKWGLTALVVIFISILLVVIFTNLPGFFALLTSIGKILSPLISGVVIAFLLNPLVNFVDCRLGPLLQKKLKVQTAKNLSRAAGIVMALIVAGFLVYGFFAMLLPQLYESVMNIVDNASTYFNSIETWATNILEDNPEIQGYVDKGPGAAARLLRKLGKDDVPQRYVEAGDDGVDVGDRGGEEPDELHHRPRGVDLHAVVEGHVPRADEEDHGRDDASLWRPTGCLRWGAMRIAFSTASSSASSSTRPSSAYSATSAARS